MEERDYVRVAEALQASAYGRGWMRVARHVMPRLVPAADLEQLDDDGLPEGICSHAKTGVLKLVSAHSVMITPRGLNWFKYEPGAGADLSDDERDWYRKVTQVTQEEFETSNFYTACIAMIIDRVVSGTGLLLVEEDERTRGCLFTHVPAGTYRLAESKQHEVDTVLRKFKYTAHQAEQAFGRRALDADMAAALERPEERYSREFEVWHLVMPRDVAERGNAAAGMTAGRDMAWASVYIAVGSKKVLAEGGYEEFPYMASRFIKEGNQVYGDSALLGLERVIGKYLEVEEAMAEGAKAAVFPRLLSSPDMADKLDLRAGGVTVLSRESMEGGLPREWASASRYQEGLMLLEQYRMEIDDGLFVSQFQSVSQQTRQMTAREVAARENEKLMTFSQTFTQFAADFRPLMARVFCILFRMGRYELEGVPEGVFAETGRGVKLLSPAVKYLGKMSKALESAKEEGLMSSVTFAVEMYQATQDAAWLDYFKPYECMKWLTDENNVDTMCLRSSGEAKREADKRVVAAQMQQAAALEEQMAAAAANRARSEER